VRPLRVLCLDGGGAKGLATIEMIRGLEKASGRHVRGLFDLIAGTSIGGCLSIFLASGSSTDQAVALMEGMCFSGVDGKGKDAVMAYSASHPLRLLTHGSRVPAAVVERYLAHCSTALGLGSSVAAPRPSPGGWPHVFTVSSVSTKNAQFWVPFVASNYERRLASSSEARAETSSQDVEIVVEAAAAPFVLAGSADWSLPAMMRATSAAPTYFPPYVHTDGREHVDGAIVANNPAIVALKEAASLWPGRSVGALVSLGTGKATDSPKTASGLLYWAGTMLSMPTQVYATHLEAKAAIRSQPRHEAGLPLYSRLEPTTGDFALDESRPQQLKAMRRSTVEYLQRKAAKVNRTALALLALSDEPCHQAVACCGGLEAIDDEMVREVLVSCGGDPLVGVEGD